MATRHLALGLLVLSAALAGCLAGPGGSSGGPDEAPPVERLGGWANPDIPVVDVDVADLTGDGHTDLVVAQENGSITVLDLANRSTHLQVDVGFGLQAIAAVGGERGPAIAVVQSSGEPFDSFEEGFYFTTRDGTELSLLDASDGKTLAHRTIDDLYADAVVADDLDGDGVEDLVLAGRSSDAYLPFPYRDTTEVAVVEGRFGNGSGPSWGPDEGEDAVRWRQAIDGDLVELGPVVDDKIPVATDDGVAAFDSVGHRLWGIELPDVVDLDADAVGVLAVAPGGAVRAPWNGSGAWTTNLTGGSGGLLDGPGGQAVIAEHVHDDETADRVRVAAYAADGNLTHRTEINGTGPVADLARVDLVGHGATIAVGIVRDNGTEIAFLDAELGLRATAGPKAAGHHEDRLIGADVVPTGRDEAVLVGVEARVHVFGQP